MKRLIIGIIASLLIFVAVILNVNNVLTHENERKSTNIEVLNSKQVNYTTKDGKQAVKVQALTYTKSELKKYEPELVTTAKNSGVRKSDIQSIARVTTKTTATFLPAVHDTVIKTDTLKCLAFSDPYLKLSGCVGDSMQVEVYDTLTYVVEKVRKRFLFIRYGVKGINLHVISKNPYTRFTSEKYIQLE